MNKAIPFYFIPIVLLLSACNFTLAADVTPPSGYRSDSIAQAQAESTPAPLYPLVPPDPNNGLVIYAEKCAPCHGETGLGDGPRAQDLPNPVSPIGTADVARSASPSKWFDIVTQGNLERFMPPFPSLNDRQRWDVVAYSLSLSSTRQDLEQAEKNYLAHCLVCHGTEGNGDGAGAGELSMPKFTDQEFMARKTAGNFFQIISSGSANGMPAFSEQLSEEERWGLTAYVRNFSFATQVAAENQVSATVLTSTPETQSTSQEPAETPVAMLQTPGKVAGQVMYASGDPAPEGLDVMLHAFDQMQLVYTATTQIREDGSYLFDGVDIKPGLTFLSTTDLNGVVYGSEMMVVEEEAGEISLPIQVYQSSTDPTILSVDRLHYFFEFLDDQRVRVVELFIISNPTDKSLVATKQGEPTLTFSLPENATNLQIEDGELGAGRYVQTESGFGDLAAVRPGSGSYQVLFSYEMPYDRKLELSRPIDFNTNALVILVPENSIKVKGEGIVDAGARDVQGTPYHIYNGEAMKAGAELKLTVTGRPTSGNPALVATSQSNLIVGLGALGIVLIAAGIWMYLRSRPAPATVQPASPPIKRREDTPESIMDAILALDDLYQEGQLPEDAYLQRRGELKAQLKEMVEG